MPLNMLALTNYWKKWIGETQGLKKSNAVAIKRAQEQKIHKRS